VLALGATASALQQSLVLPALPDVQRELGVSTATAGWVLSAYLISGGVATPFAGRLGDMYGKRRVLLCVLTLFAVGTAVSAAAPVFAVLCAGRAVQGISAGVFPLAFGIVRDQFPADRVAFGIGLLGSMLGIGSGLGVVLAGPIVSGLSYHWLFWLPLAGVLVALAAAWAVVPESPSRSGGRINWAAGALMSLGLVLGLLGLTATSRRGWLAAGTLALFAGAAVCLLAWVAVERRSAVPLVDVRLLRLRGVWTANVVALMLGIGMYSTFVLVPQLAREPGFGLGASALGAGLYLVPTTVAMLLVGTQAGRIEQRLGSKPPLVAGGAVALLALTLLSVEHADPALICLAAALLGCGFGLAFAAMTTLAVRSVPRSATGLAGGMNHLTRLVGSALGAQIAATLLDGRARTGHSYTLAFAVGAAALAAGVAGASLAPEAVKHRRRTPRGTATAEGGEGATPVRRDMRPHGSYRRI
jgi:MFS family permease